MEDNVIPEHKRFPNIAKATLEMAYDNGGLNRDRTEAGLMKDLDELLGAEGMDTKDLAAIDRWLATLSKDELKTLCAGEENDQKKLARDKQAPEKMDSLLNDIFNNVI